MSRRSSASGVRPAVAGLVVCAVAVLTAACGSDPVAVPAAPVTTTVTTTTTVSAAPVTTTVVTTAVSTVTEQVLSTVVEQVVATVTEQVAIQPIAAPVPAAQVPVAQVPVAAAVAEPEPAASAYYANCSEARAAGAAPLHRGDAGYRAAMDRDDDGVACE